MIPSSSLCLISSCLLGLCTRYDGKTKEAVDLMGTTADAIWIPVCPEQLGGLPTPRDAAEIVGGDGFDVLTGQAKVLTRSGVDVTENFLRGARETAKLAKTLGIKRAVLKARSPSCGVSSPNGVTAAMLIKAGIQVTQC